VKRSFSILMLLGLLLPLWGQQTSQYVRESGRMIFFDRNISPYIPHFARMQQHGIALHNQVWNTDSNSYYVPDTPVLLFTDWSDDGNGGVSPFPVSNIQIGMAPMNMTFYVAPSVERYYHLFSHEQTHVVMTDKATKADMGWRKFLGGKIPVDNRHPASAVWSYFSTPRWYAPRWYHEGIACFMETWMSNGIGRAIGGYDEMYFRSLVADSARMSSVVGLESEGSTTDFQLGTNAYLYGTRFVNYLVLRNGFDTLVRWYNRTEGSSRFFAKQFKKTYGAGIRQVWNEWQQYEHQHQAENIAAVRQHPVTEVRNITAKPLGSVAAMAFDSAAQKIYTAINHPGRFARLVSIDMHSGNIRKLTYVNGPRLYFPSYLTFDSKRRRVLFTIYNQDIRGISIYDLNKNRVVKRLKNQRLSNLVYDNRHDCMYALFTHLGVTSIMRLDSSLRDRQMLYRFPFGTEVFDLAVSHDGEKLSVTISGENGEHKLLLFKIRDLQRANFKYETVAEFDNANLSGFTFSRDDQYLIGSSYYTGVSNLVRIHIATKQMEWMSNSESGLFWPVDIAEDTLLALNFCRDGLQPVLVAKRICEEGSNIHYLGQKAYDHDSERLSRLCELEQPLPEIQFKAVSDGIVRYRSIGEMRFVGAYPDLTGFVDKQACNSVTPVLGYRFLFSDPVGFSNLNIHIGASPWSHNDWLNRFHFDLDWRFRFWQFKACWNHSDFYDLIGPMQTSRKGYSVSLSYKHINKLWMPYEYRWGASIAAYGLMDALPTAQTIAADIRSMQSLSAFYYIRHTRKSLGGIKDEQGWEVGADGYLSLVNKTFYPELLLTANGGVLLPILRNTSLWLRNTAGYNFVNDGSAFSKEYFGGFQNNYIDCSTPYRSSGLFNYNTLPGAGLFEIQASYFLRSQLQLDLQPIRFNNFGALSFYPTWLQLSPFAGYLLASPDYGSAHIAHYIDYGATLSVEVMLFNYMRTTWSIGYGRANAFVSGTANPDWNGRGRNEWMFTVKIL